MEKIIDYFTQRPDEKLDYDFDFTIFLASDTISSHSVSADTGITVDTITAIYPKVRVWLKDGTAGRDYVVRCQVITAAGKTRRAEMVLQIRNASK